MGRLSCGHDKIVRFPPYCAVCADVRHCPERGKTGSSRSRTELLLGAETGRSPAHYRTAAVDPKADRYASFLLCTSQKDIEVRSITGSVVMRIRLCIIGRTVILVSAACAIRIRPSVLTAPAVPVVTRGAMGRNPFATPTAPMPWHGMKSPAAAAVHLNDRRCASGLGSWGKRRCLRGHRSRPNAERADQNQSRRAHVGFSIQKPCPERYLGGRNSIPRPMTRTSRRSAGSW